MRIKLLFISTATICLSLLLLSCSDNKDEPSVMTTEFIYNSLNLLNGVYHGEHYSETTNTTEHEDIVFTPYMPFGKTKEVYGVLSGTITVFGTASVCSYHNDHLLETNKTYYLSFNDYGEYPPEYVFYVSFYQYGDHGKVIGSEDRRIVTILSKNKFLMRRYGTTEENNLLYVKQ